MANGFPQIALSLMRLALPKSNTTAVDRLFNELASDRCAAGLDCRARARFCRSPAAMRSPPANGLNGDTRYRRRLT